MNGHPLVLARQLSQLTKWDPSPMTLTPEDRARVDGVLAGTGCEILFS